MKIPRLLYGRYADVRARMNPALTRLKHGASWEDAMASGDFVETADAPGLLVLHGPSQLLGGSEHYHLYVPLTALARRMRDQGLPEALEDRAFKESLGTVWGVLGLVATANQMRVYPAARHGPFLDAVLRFWNEMDAEGARYTSGLADGARLWETPNNIHHTLANMGIPGDTLRAPLPGGGLADLAARASRVN